MLKVAVLKHNALFSKETVQYLKTHPLIEEIYLIESKCRYPEADLVILATGETIEQMGISMDIANWYSENSQKTKIIYYLENDKLIENLFLEDFNLLGILRDPISFLTLDRYIQKMLYTESNEVLLKTKVRGKDFAIKADDILYVESNNHTINIISSEGHSYTAYEKLSEIKLRLPNSFLQCHKSYLVNQRKIKKIQKNQITLQNDIVLPISKSRLSTVRASISIQSS